MLFKSLIISDKERNLCVCYSKKVNLTFIGKMYFKNKEIVQLCEKNPLKGGAKNIIRI